MSTLSVTINKISIVIPVYNEENSLLKILDSITIVCKQINIDYEILLIDDGSIDNSVSIMTEAAKKENSHVIAIILDRNYGQHSALMAGFNYVSGDLIITLDADLQNPPEEIPQLVKIANEGYDVVGTIRKKRKDNLFRKISSKMINIFIKYITGKKIADYGCMFRAYKRHIINDIIHYYNGRRIFIPVLASILANKSIEIPIMHVERKFGKSKYNILKLFYLMNDLLISLAVIKPLRILNLLMIIILILSFILFISFVIFYLFIKNYCIIKSIFILFIILLFFIVIQFISIRLLEKNINYININYLHSRPNYLIKRIVR